MMKKITFTYLLKGFMIRSIQYFTQVLPHSYAPQLVFYLVASLVGGVACHAAHAEKKPFCAKEAFNIVSKTTDNTFKGDIEYRINPTFFSKDIAAANRPIAPVVIKRIYTSPEKRTDTILLSPLRLAEVEAYATLVKASQAHMGQYDDFFFSNNKSGDSEKIKHAWSMKRVKDKKERMVIYYYEGEYKNDQENVKWIPIGEVGLNGMHHENNGEEIFYWGGDPSYLATQVKNATHLKGVMSVATKGFMHSISRERPKLKTFLGLVKPQNTNSSNLLKNIGFTRKKGNDRSGYEAYAFEKQKFQDNYLVEWDNPEKPSFWEPTPSKLIVGLCLLAAGGLLCLWIYRTTRVQRR